MVGFTQTRLATRHVASRRLSHFPAPLTLLPVCKSRHLITSQKEVKGGFIKPPSLSMLVAATLPCPIGPHGQPRRYPVFRAFAESVRYFLLSSFPSLRLILCAIFCFLALGGSARWVLVEGLWPQDQGLQNNLVDFGRPRGLVRFYYPTMPTQKSCSLLNQNPLTHFLDVEIGVEFPAFRSVHPLCVVRALSEQRKEGKKTLPADPHWISESGVGGF